VPFTSLLDTFPNLRQVITSQAVYDFAFHQSNRGREVCVTENVTFTLRKIDQRQLKERILRLPKDWTVKWRYNLKIRYGFEEHDDYDDEDELYHKEDPLPPLMQLDIESIEIAGYWHFSSLVDLLEQRESEGYRRIKRVQVCLDDMEHGDIFKRPPVPCDHLQMIFQHQCTCDVSILDILVQPITPEEWREVKTLELDLVVNTAEEVGRAARWDEANGVETIDTDTSCLPNGPLNLGYLILHIRGDPVEALRDMPAYSVIAQGLLRIADPNCHFILDCAVAEEADVATRDVAKAAGQAIHYGVNKEIQVLLARRSGEPGWKRFEVAEPSAAAH
jgi:hypothetical protein